MTQKFENLHAEALQLADAALAHIAETTHISDAETERITARAMEKAGFAKPAQKPVLRQVRIRFL